MPKVTLIQTNFTAGEVSPKLLGRVDIARYANGARIIENAYPMVHGGVSRRPGTRFVAAAKFADKRARLIPYIFNKEQAYMLEFGDLYMRVYKDGAQVLNAGGQPYEVVTPYTVDMLTEINFVQGADTMFIAHPNVPIQRLRRFGHASWDLLPAPFVVTPFDELGDTPATGLTLSSAAIGAGRTFTAGAASFQASDVGREILSLAGVATITQYISTTVVTCTITVAFPGTSLASGSWTIAGSPQTTCTPSAKDPVGSTITLTLGAAGWRAADVGKFVKINGGLAQITSYSSPTVVNATIKQALTANVAAPALAWSLETSVWGGGYGYPAAVTLSEQRLIAAGSPGYPQTVWMSRTGEYLNFELGTKDDDAMSFTISSDQINPIAHLANIKALIALTYGGEFSILGGVEKPITPTNIHVKSQSVYGCNGVRPHRIGNELYFVQRAGRKLRAMSAKLDAIDTASYGSPDLSVLAEHATETGVVDAAYQQEPDSVLWLVRADGVLATVSVDRDQDVVGWARQVTAGAFESVASIPVAAGDEMWVVTRRIVGGNTVRYIERFDRAVATDAAITGSNPAGSIVWSGLGHLEGCEVDVVADGVVMQRQTVAGGQITLSRTANAVQVGLPFETTVETLTPEIAGGTGSAQGNSMRIGEVTLRFLETTGVEINGQVAAFRNLGKALLDKPAPLFTGDHRIEILGWERGKAMLTIKQKQPLPFHLLAVIKKFTTND